MTPYTLERDANDPRDLLPVPRPRPEGREKKRERSRAHESPALARGRPRHPAALVRVSSTPLRTFLTKRSDDRRKTRRPDSDGAGDGGDPPGLAMRPHAGPSKAMTKESEPSDARFENLRRRTRRRPDETRRSARPVYPLAVSRALHPLFRVLFNFPSQYLFAIGLAQVLSLRWSLPPASGCTAKQPDSGVWVGGREQSPARAWHPLWTSHAREDWRDAPHPLDTDPNATAPRGQGPWGDSALGSSRFTRRY